MAGPANDMRIELTKEQRQALANVTYLEIDIDERLASKVQVRIESIPQPDPLRMEASLVIKVPDDKVDDSR